jgi:hypothetical protein
VEPRVSDFTYNRGQFFKRNAVPVQAKLDLS